ncbi:MAG TPA: type I methionyl aminopeptidase, partial [Parvibaculum sp.]
IEPFLSCGASHAQDTDDGWTLIADRPAPTVQYEHSLVVTRNGPLILTVV